MPVSETETLEAIALLPEHSWLRQYVIHALKQTVAPLCYHIGIGIAVLGVTCPIHYGMSYAGPLRANNFVLCVGRSGEDNKSTALNIGIELLKSAESSLIGDFPGSQEGLIESLMDQESQVIPMSEFGKFLSSAQRGYFEPIKTALTDLWDCGKQTRRKAAQRGQVVKVEVENPRLSIAAACSIPYLEKHTLSEDWTGGFMGRWLVFYGMRERYDANPVGDDSMVPLLKEGLQSRAQTASAGFCKGLTPEAQELWDEWYKDIVHRRLPNNIVGIRSRAPTIARKLCLVLAWDYGLAREGAPWDLDVDILRPAIAITELHVKSLVDLSSMIAEHADARMRRSVIDAVECVGGVATLGEILSHLKMRKRPVVEVLDSLIEEGRIKRIKTSLGYSYELQ